MEDVTCGEALVSERVGADVVEVDAGTAEDSDADEDDADPGDGRLNTAWMVSPSTK